MIHTTNFKRLICCVLVVLLVSFCVLRPMTAYAVEPISMTVVGISAACVIGAILIALGVRPLVNTSLDGFEQLVNDIVSQLPEEFIIMNTLVGVAAKMILSDGITYAPRNLVTWILDYLVAPADTSVAPTVEAVFTPSEAPRQSYNVLYNFAVNHGTSLDAEFASAINKMSYCALVRLKMLDTSDSSFFTSYGYLWYNVLPSFSAVSGITLNGQYCEKAMQITYNGEYVLAYSRSGLADGDYVRICATGSYSDFYLANVSAVRLSNPASKSAYAASGDSLTLDDSFADTLDSSAYTSWTSKGVTVPDSLAGTGTISLPLSVPATVADAVDRSYADTISGTKTVAETVSLTETDTGTDVGTGTASLWQTLWGWLQKIWTAIKDLVSGITVPITNAIANVRSVAKSIADFFATTMVIESPMTAIHFGALFDLFPFNIPHGIYTAVTFWNATASPPVITIPLPTFSNGSVGIYEFEINFSEIPGMDTLSAIIRGGELILFAIGLLMVTRKVTKW